MRYESYFTLTSLYYIPLLSYYVVNDISICTNYIYTAQCFLGNTKITRSVKQISDKSNRQSVISKSVTDSTVSTDISVTDRSDVQWRWNTYKCGV